MTGVQTCALPISQKIWRETVNQYTPPVRDPAVTEAIDAFVARRKEEGGAHPVS